MNYSAPLIVATLLLSVPCLAADPVIYKSVGADGTVVFTDKPAPEATVVTPTPLNIMEAQNSEPLETEKPTSSATQSESGEVEISVDDTSVDDTNVSMDITDVTIVSPQDQQTLTDHEGPIWVGIQTSPAPTMPPGLSAEIRLNGKLVVSGWSTTLPMDVPERGAHVLRATIVDMDGAVLAESDEINLFIKQRVVTHSGGQ